MSWSKVNWSGSFNQGGQDTNMQFAHMWYDADGNVAGSGNDAVGEFGISGTHTNYGTMNFDKQYVGAHCVKYSGTITNNGKDINGQWEIPGNCDGSFTIQATMPQWTGYFAQGGTDYDMNLDMYVGQYSVGGSGSDDVGQFWVSGTRNGDNVSFAKQYVGAHTVQYTGTLSGKSMSGNWEIPGNCDGTWRMSFLNTKNVSWDGQFNQGGTDYPMEFNHMWFGAEGDVTGSGSDAVGQFNLNGTHSSYGSVTFTKQYVGAHAVQYTGNLDGNSLTGEWEIVGNCSGTFSINATLPTWKGHYNQDGNDYDMDIKMFMRNGTVGGNGTDAVGAFWINGTDNNGEVAFVKQYVGQHSVNYAGTFNRNKVEGTWEIPGNCNGSFKLRYVVV